MQNKIVPFLWFDGQAEEAITLYTSIFKDSSVKTITRYGEGGPGKPGSLMTAEFTLQGQEFIALNGGPHYTFNEAISFVINCETQEEVDWYWNSLVKNGTPQRCGWLKDRFGLSWQVVPGILGKLLSDKDPAKAQRAMQAMLKMEKLDIAELMRAADGK